MKKKKIEISPERIGNLIRNYHWVKWDKKTVKLGNVGWGDRPQWSISGLYKGFKLIWTSAGPGGSEPSMKILHRGKQIKSVRPAPYVESYFVRMKIDWIIKKAQKK